MTTTITVGSGGDFSGWQLAEDSLGTLTDNTIVAQLNQALTITAEVAWDGITVGAFTLTATAGTGNSFVDNMNPLSDALTWNSSLGASLDASAFMNGMFNCNVQMTVSRLQFRFSNASYDKNIIRIRQSGSVFDQNIVLATATPSGNGTLLDAVQGGACTLQRSLLIAQGNYTGLYAAGATISNVGCVNTAGGSGKSGINALYGNPLVKNCYSVGFATDYTGTANASSSNNATSAGGFSGTNFGGSGQNTVVAATEFESASGAGDWRLKSTSAKLRANGTATGTPSTDIFGNAWNSGTPDISPIRFADTPGTASATFFAYTRNHLTAGAVS